MHVELINVSLVGLGAQVDVSKVRDGSLPGEDIKMSIDASLAFPGENRIDCVVTVETASESAIRMKVTYLGIFRLHTEKVLADEDQNRISAACTSKLFPYIREAVADVSRRMPIAQHISLHPSLGDEQSMLQQMTLTSVNFPQADEAGEKTKKTTSKRKIQ